MTTAIVRAEPSSQQRGIIQAHDVNSLWQFAEILAKSQCMPASWATQQTAFVALQMGSEVGLSLGQTIKSVYVVNKIPSLYGDAPLALCMASGLFDHSQFVETYDPETQIASTTACRIGGLPVTRTFSMADAVQAGLPGRNQNYKFYPQRMLPRRARAFALRDTFPDVLMGLAIKEEIEDEGEIIDMEPQPNPTTRAATLQAQLVATSPTTPPTLAPTKALSAIESQPEPESPQTQETPVDTESPAEPPPPAGAGDPLAPDPKVEIIAQIKAMSLQITNLGGNTTEIRNKHGFADGKKTLATSTLEEVDAVAVDLSELLAAVMSKQPPEPAIDPFALDDESPAGARKRGRPRKSS